MKLQSLTKMLLATVLLLGVTAATNKSATAESYDSSTCDKMYYDNYKECPQQQVEHPGNQHVPTHPPTVKHTVHPPKVEYEVHPPYVDYQVHPPRVEHKVHPPYVEHQVHPSHPSHPPKQEYPVHPPRPSHRPPVKHPYSNSLLNRFYCGTGEDGVPTTFVETAQGTYPVIRWVSDYFTPHGYEQTTRCRQVSDKFQTHFNDGSLNYITTGIVNHQPVICVSDTSGGTCQGVLFTLKPEQNASRIIQRLFDLRSGAASGPLEETGSRLYLDFNRYLEDTIQRR